MIEVIVGTGGGWKDSGEGWGDSLPFRQVRRDAHEYSHIKCLVLVSTRAVKGRPFRRVVQRSVHRILVPTMQVRFLPLPPTSKKVDADNTTLFTGESLSGDTDFPLNEI